MQGFGFLKLIFLGVPIFLGVMASVGESWEGRMRVTKGVSHPRNMLSGAQSLLGRAVCCEVFADPVVDRKCSHSRKELTRMEDFPYCRR